MPINITFKVSGGAQFNLELEPSMTVMDVKKQAEPQCNFPANSMKIIYKGRILKNDDKLESHKVEDGHSMHVVKGLNADAAAPAAAAPVEVPAATATPAAFPGLSATGAPAMAGMGGAPDMSAMMQMMGGGGMGGMPGGMGGMPGGMGGMPGGMPGMDGGGMNPEMLANMLQSPMVQQIMQQMSQNPAMLQQMMQSNPMLQQMTQRDPMFAQMMQNPHFMQMMLNPQTLQGFLGMAQGGGAALPAAQEMNMPPVTPATGGPPIDMTGQAAPMGGAPGANPLAAMMNDPAMMQMAMQFMQGGMQGGAPGAMPGMPGIMPGAMPGMPGVMPGMPGVMPGAMPGMGVDSRPPEERYAAQLTQLQSMGFPDQPSNIQALQMANGDVNQAINFLLGGQ